MLTDSKAGPLQFEQWKFGKHEKFYMGNKNVQGASQRRRHGNVNLGRMPLLGEIIGIKATMY